MAEKLSCGRCAACCFFFSIDELDKKFCTWCVHAKPADGGGCTIYENRPTPCREYRCGWLVSQDIPGKEMPLNMRPDHSRCMFSVHPENTKHTYVHCFPAYPDAWKKGQVWDKIQDLVERGGTVEVVVGEWRNLLRAGKPILRFHESVLGQATPKSVQLDC